MCVSAEVWVAMWVLLVGWCEVNTVRECWINWVAVVVIWCSNGCGSEVAVGGIGLLLGVVVKW